MEREILFRGQRCDNKEWAEGALWNKCGSGCTIISGDGAHSDCFAYVIPETVGQFTGLCDKNGVKIFEGDILLCENVNYLLVNSPAMACELHQIGVDTTNGDGVYFLFHYNNICQIIGNIYDNQELLK